MVTSNELFSPAKAAREWAQRHGRASDATVIEAWVRGWNARCIPEEPGALADHLRSMLLDGTVQCPLCGKTGPHGHSPEEIVIYRNGVKYGRSLKLASDETAAPQAPIAKIIVRNDDLADVLLYAPGLPPGEHDVYLDPSAPGLSEKPSDQVLPTRQLGPNTSVEVEVTEEASGGRQALPEDIVDELEAEGSALSKRAARYIRIKRQTEAGLEQQLRSMCRKSLASESPEPVSERLND